MQGSGRVLQLFFKLREERGGPPAPRHFYKRCWAYADAYLKWCEDEGIDDPLAFIGYRFQCASYAGRPLRLNQLRSKKLAAIWNEWREGEHLAERKAEQLKAKAGTPRQQLVKHLRVLTPGQEVAKSHYLHGRHDLCLAEAGVTGGYHPSSRYCPRCPAALRCAATLYQRHGFDVVALRAGRLVDLPPDVAAAAVR